MVRRDILCGMIAGGSGAYALKGLSDYALQRAALLQGYLVRTPELTKEAIELANKAVDATVDFPLAALLFGISAGGLTIAALSDAFSGREDNVAPTERSDRTVTRIEEDS